MRKATLFALLSLLFLPLGLRAQNVTVSPTSGSLMAALTYDGEVGFENGWSAMWRHEQLPLTFTVADDNQLTEGGEISNPAGNINVYNNRLVIMGGQTPDLYCVLSLPKGFRITEYRIVLVNDLKGRNINNMSISNNVSNSFYETGSDYDTSNYKARAIQTDNKDNYVIGARDDKEFVIHRTSDDMGNQLYFRMTKTANLYYGVSIKSFDVYFTAEGTFEADVKPDTVGPARSVVAAPFKTSKIDVGDLKRETKNGKTFFAYNYHNVRDLVGYTYLYQENAIENGEPSDVAAEKHIYPVQVDGKYLYGLCNDTYYIETPIQVHTQTGLESPVGYRIVGAKFDYLWGTASEGNTEVIPTTCTIYYNRNGSTLYLNDQLQFTTTLYYWSIDDVGNIVTNTGTRYLSCSGNNDDRSITLSQLKDNQYNLRRDDNGRIYYKSSSTYYYLQYYNGTYQRTLNNRDWYRWDTSLLGTNYASYTPKVVKSTNLYDENDYITQGGILGIGSHREYGCYRSDMLVTSDKKIGTVIEYPAFNPGAYTLTIYDKTGKANATEPITVNNASDTGSFYLEGLNNDAVKFSISGLENGKQALVSVTLEMQALDPYIDKMDIVCHDADNQLSLSQPFTADDFSVSGGSFKFYIPEEYKDSLLTFTFADLYSKYGDNTYYAGTPDQKNGNARYSFVTSEYFESVDGADDDGLYSSTYNPDASYVNKVFTSKAGNIRFKFNNAEDLGNSSTGTGYLEENPFSMATYLGSEDPDGSDLRGANIDCQLKASDETQKSGIYYVFTADETRYNIAPSTAWQHRSYAFYRMDIELEAKTYTPELTWTKLYDSSCFENNGAVDIASMWGLKLATIDSQTLENVEGYLTTHEIDEAITAALGTENCPTSADQILYIDGSELYSILNSSTITLSELKSKLAPNALFYLPERTTSTLDNFAYRVGDYFRAGKNIVITDKQPFFAPYDIQVDAANYATYTRQVTVPKNGQVTNASVMLPFTLSLSDDGVHTNPANTPGSGQTFTVNRLGSNIIERTGETGSFDYGVAYFSALTEDKTEANKPYMIKVSSNPEDKKISFIATQKGSLIVKTPKGSALEGYTHTGEFINGDIKERVKFGDQTLNFTNYGSYSGAMIDHGPDQIFYLASNQFLTMKELLPSLKLNMIPFRGFYVYTVASPSQNFTLRRFAVSYEAPANELTEADLEILVNFVLTGTLPEGKKPETYDVDGNGVVDIADVTALIAKLRE